MEFLRQLLMRCRNWLATLVRDRCHVELDAPAIARELSGEETVARFIYSKSNIWKSSNRPKPNAFDPSPHDELSAAHTTNLADSEVWKIAILTLGDEVGRSKVYARADVQVEAFIRNNLRAIRDDDPFERHSSIVGWPNAEDPTERKERLKQVCLELSQCPEVKLVIPENPITRV